MTAGSTLGKFTDAVVDGAKTAVGAPTDYVVDPVGKALGPIIGASNLSPTAVAADKPLPKAVRKAARKLAVAKSVDDRKVVTLARRTRTR
jgi:hypothetical protein